MPPFFAEMNKQELREAIQKEVANFGFDEPFECSLISDLIVEKHYYCSVHGLRPSQFKKTEEKGRRYVFWGCFDRGWHRVSWRQCIYPKNDRDLVITALRLEAKPLTTAHVAANHLCEGCALRPAMDCHHARPTFEEMADRAIAALAVKDWRAIYEAFNWWEEEAFRLPEGSPALAQFRSEHATAMLEALCRECHLRR